ncbi:MAG: mannose-6-phosphate isomerase [Lactobacillus sp.]|jgi:mannose-6-phosphate isomerase|nr:MAG: mannose-6-phosphate isomerase [Lactobacillus sp.]
MKYILRMLPNRVRRNYQGGKGIDWLHGKKKASDGDTPEEWVASTMLAINPGLPLIKNEGQSKCDIDGKSEYLEELIKKQPELYFGKEYVAQKGTDPGFLFKILDSSMRLHVQAHPTRQFAREKMNSPYGKLECYYILHVRDGVDPYIRLGFQHAPTKEEWKRIIETQDITAMDHCFDKVPVHEGEVWYVPGGMPHAIGGGILMLEIMEPSDLVVRCEFNRHGIIVPPEARFMGRSLDFCLDIFDYHQYSVDDIRKRCNLNPVAEKIEANYNLVKIIDKDLTGSFKVSDLKIKNGNATLNISKFLVGVVVEGKVTITHGDESENFKRGDTFVIAATAESVKINSHDKPAEVTFVESKL